MSNILARRVFNIIATTENMVSSPIMTMNSDSSIMVCFTVIGLINCAI